MSDHEHRRSPRITQGFLVRYRRPGETSWFVSSLRDLSSHGVRFIGECVFDVGTELELQLVLPMAKGPLALQGRVIRTTPGPMRLTAYGVTFQAGEASVQEMIDEAVAYFLRKQRER